MSSISIIVPVYKVEPYLHRCVDSILTQTFTDFELVLIDDGSPDNCGKICDNYAEKDNRIHVIHQQNGGLSAARNTGIDWVFANSNCQWICFIDSDDWVHPQYLELLLEANKKFSTKISQCGLYRTKGEAEEKKIGRKMFCITPEEQYAKWYTSYACGKVYDRSLFSSVRYPIGTLFEDVTIWIDILFSIDKIAIVDEPLYYYFQREDGITNSTWTPAKLAQIEAWEDQLSFARKHGDKSVLQTALFRYCWVYKHQCEEISISNLVSEEEKKEYRSRLLRRFRFVLFQYRKELKEMGIFKDYVAWAFKKTYLVYKTVKSKFDKSGR